MQNTEKLTLPAPPATCSALIRLALADLKAVRELPGYEVQMSSWHEQMEADGTCYVCLAGAVMARTLKADPEMDLCPPDYEDEGWQEPLSALNELRLGNLAYAGRIWKPAALKIPHFDVPSYNADSDRFITTMEAMAAAYEAAEQRSEPL